MYESEAVSFVFGLWHAHLTLQQSPPGLPAASCLHFKGTQTMNSDLQWPSILQFTH